MSHIDPNGRRSSPGYYLRDTVREGKYAITLSLNTLATKIIFDKNGKKPKAIGIEYLQGKSLYSADPRYNASDKGIPGKAYASKEIIVSGGAFNTPQLLLLSGIGPAAHLKKFSIPVVVDSPGVGQSVAVSQVPSHTICPRVPICTNQSIMLQLNTASVFSNISSIQDNYEAGILTLGFRAVTGHSEIFPAFWKTSKAIIRDIYMWCGGFSFEGFWPGFPNIPPTFTETHGPNQYECALVHMNPRSQAGVIELRSTDPRDVPTINLNFFKTGADQDLSAILEGIDWVRSWLSRVPATTNSLAPFTELHPCGGVIGKQNCTEQSQKTYLKEQAYSHHATSSARIGADGDRLAVLDSKFRVRGVTGLRVVGNYIPPKYCMVIIEP